MKILFSLLAVGCWLAQPMLAIAQKTPDRSVKIRVERTENGKTRVYERTLTGDTVLLNGEFLWDSDSLPLPNHPLRIFLNHGGKDSLRANYFSYLNDSTKCDLRVRVVQFDSTWKRVHQQWRQHHQEWRRTADSLGEGHRARFFWFSDTTRPFPPLPPLPPLAPLPLNQESNTFMFRADDFEVTEKTDASGRMIIVTRKSKHHKAKPTRRGENQKSMQPFGPGLHLYPNPGRGRAILAFTQPQAADLVITVTDSQGKTVYREKLRNFAGEYRKEINFEGKPGVYVVSVTGPDSTLTQRLVIE